MNPYLAVLALLGLVAVTWRFTRRKPRADGPERARRAERKLEGYQVWTPLHVRMGRGCIFDHGMQYGPGFRRKEGPLLPHDPHCRCETLPFTLAGSEVLAGALRRVGKLKTLEAGFPVSAIAPTLAALKRINAEPTHKDKEGYLALVGVDSFQEPDRSAVTAFLLERYAFLTQQQHVSITQAPLPGEPEGAAIDAALKIP